MANRIQNLNITAHDLKKAGFSDRMVKDYSLIAHNFNILSTQFQWLKSGSQAVTGAFQPLTGWVSDRDTGAFRTDQAAGTITIPKTGDYQLDCFVQGDAATGITIKAQKYDGASWTDIPGAIAIATQHAVISGCLFTAAVSELIRVVITGGAMNIATNKARITIGRKS